MWYVLVSTRVKFTIADSRQVLWSLKWWIDSQKPQCKSRGHQCYLHLSHLSPLWPSLSLSFLIPIPFICSPYLNSMVWFHIITFLQFHIIIPSPPPFDQIIVDSYLIKFQDYIKIPLILQLLCHRNHPLILQLLLCHRNYPLKHSLLLDQKSLIFNQRWRFHSLRYKI